MEAHLIDATDKPVHFLDLFSNAAGWGSRLCCVQLRDEEDNLLLDVGDEDDCSLERHELDPTERVVGFLTRVDISYSRYEHYDCQLLIS